MNTKKTKLKGSFDFEINLDEIPNGNRKPIEACEFIKQMEKARWRPSFPK